MLFCLEHFTYLIVTYRRHCSRPTKVITGTMAQIGTSGTINIVKTLHFLHYSGQSRLEESYKKLNRLKNFKFITHFVDVHRRMGIFDNS
jgi:hypothetical protein